MEKLAGILDRKQAHFLRVEPNCPLQQAWARMKAQHTDHLIVMNEEDQFIGILTEHDVADRALYNGNSSKMLSVQEVLHTQWPVADIHHTLEQCMRMMEHFHVRFVPVFDKMEFKGVVSLYDVLSEAVRHRADIFDKVDRNRIREFSY